MLGFFIACGLGALLRFLFSGANSRAGLPFGTLLANLVGTFLLGYVYRHLENPALTLALGTGFCGSLTTFSTLQAEVLDLKKEKKSWLLYLVLTYFLGFLAFLLGIWL